MSTSDKLDERRRVAEARLQLKSQSNLDMDAKDLPRLVQELHAHQIELELQNEELRTSQIALDAAQARYFDLYDTAPVGYCTLSEAGLIQEANLTLANLLGISRSALVKQPLSRFILNTNADRFYRQRRMLIDTGEPQTYELQMVINSGTPFWASVSSTLAQEADGTPVLRFVLSDISASKQVEAELLSTKNKLQATLDAIPDLLFEVDVEGRIHDYHSHRTDLLAATPDVFMGKRISEILPADTAAVCMEGMTEAANKGWSIGGQYALPLPQGERWFELSVAPKASSDGQDRRFIFLARDVTERRRIQTALLARENDLRLAVEGANLGTWHYDVGGDQLVASVRCRELFGFDLTEDVGVERFIERILPDDRESLALAFAEGIRNGEAYRLEFRVARPDGSVVWVAVAGRTLRSNRADDPLRNSGVVIDITELKSANDRFASFAAEQDRAIEAERKRLAREVHDQIGQVFTAIQLIIHSLPHEVFPAGQEVALKQALEMGITTTRKITAELRPPLLDDMGLEAALEHLVRATLPTKDLSFEFNFEINAQAGLDARQKLTLFRIAQEAVTNVLRHAGATHVVISGRRDGNHYVFGIKDNGRGFTPNDVRNGAMGLVNLGERAFLAGGSCEVSASPQGGTMVTVSMKVQDNGSDEYPVD